MKNFKSKQSGSAVDFNEKFVDVELDVVAIATLNCFGAILCRKWYTLSLGTIRYHWVQLWRFLVLKSDSHLPKRTCVISFIESPLKLMKNAFYFILKAPFVLKIFKSLSWFFGHVEKSCFDHGLIRERLISKFMTSQPG